MASRREVVAARLRELEAEMARLERFPRDEDVPQGTVLRFIKTRTVAYSRTRGDLVARAYTYVALKVGADRWYLTIGEPSYPMHQGVTPKCTYDSLIDFMADATDIEVVTRWMPLELARVAWENGTHPNEHSQVDEVDEVEVTAEVDYVNTGEDEFGDHTKN